MTGNCQDDRKWKDDRKLQDERELQNDRKLQDDREYGRRKKDCGQETRRNVKVIERLANKREDRRGGGRKKVRKKK